MFSSIDTSSDSIGSFCACIVTGAVNMDTVPIRLKASTWSPRLLSRQWKQSSVEISFVKRLNQELTSWDRDRERQWNACWSWILWLSTRPDGLFQISSVSSFLSSCKSVLNLWVAVAHSLLECAIFSGSLLVLNKLSTPVHSPQFSLPLTSQSLSLNLLSNEFPICLSPHSSSDISCACSHRVSISKCSLFSCFHHFSCLHFSTSWPLGWQLFTSSWDAQFLFLHSVSHRQTHLIWTLFAKFSSSPCGIFLTNTSLSWLLHQFLLVPLHQHCLCHHSPLPCCGIFRSSMLSSLSFSFCVFVVLPMAFLIIMHFHLTEMDLSRSTLSTAANDDFA